MNIGNQKLQKKINRERIVNLLRAKGEMSRSQITEETKLGWGSVTKYTGELIDEGLLKEVGTQKSKGRQSVILGLNEEYKYIIGLDIGGGFIKGVVVNMAGVIQEQACEPTKWDADRSTLLDQVFAIIEGLCDSIKIRPDNLLTIGCCFAGGIDFVTGEIAMANSFSDLVGVNLKQVIEDRFSVSCFVSNSIISRLLGECQSSRVSANKNVAYISLGTGVGAGIISRGKILVPTADEQIGDIAHYMVLRDGPKCKCGLHGCLEVLAGGRNVLKEIESKMGKSGSEALTWEKVAGLAAAGDNTVCSVLEQTGKYIGTAIGSMIQFHRSDSIIIGGGMTNLGNALIDPIKKTVSDYLPEERFNVENIVISDQSRFRGAIGATLYAWDNIFHSEREYVNLTLNGTTN